MSADNQQIPSTRLGPFASQSPGVVVATPLTKTMQQLLNEIDRVKIDVETSTKTLEKIDTGPENAAGNRVRLLGGRTRIKLLTECIIDLQKQMDGMTKESNPTWPTKIFDQSKQNALKTLSNLLNKLSQLDKHLVKAIGIIPTATDPNNQPVSIKDENTKGIGALFRQTSFGNTKKTTSSATTIQKTPTLSKSDDEPTSDEDEYVATDRKQELQRSSRLTKKIDTSSDESDDDESEESEESEDDDDTDDMHDQHQLLNELQKKRFVDDHSKDSRNSNHQSRGLTPPRISKKPSTAKDYSTPSLSPILGKTTIASTPTSFSRRRTSSPHQRRRISTPKNNSESQDDSSFEGEDGSKEDELERLHENREHEDEKAESIDNNRPIEEDEPIQLQSRTYDQRFRQRITPVTSASILVDVFKRNNYIPSGFIASDLAPLTQHNRYKLSCRLIPKMTESNLAFADLYWRNDTDQIYAQQVKYQRILTIKNCLKIPKIKGQQICVLNRCIRVCLYDGVEIISNIYSTRAQISDKINESDVTEDWHFESNDKHTFIDEQSQFLIRSNEFHPSKHIHLLIELTQLCQSEITKEKCEVGCGWIIIPLVHDQSSIISETKVYNKLLHGGHLHETNILLNSQYNTLNFDGLSGRIDRYKQARIKFSIESREKHIDLLYNNLPLTSMIVPINLVQAIVFYRNELAYQLQKHYHSDGLSATPLHSIFLSTFYQALEQPDIIYVLQRFYHPNPEITVQRQREEFIKIYELTIYPLLFYRLLPPYDFHDRLLINERRKIISEMVKKQLATKQNNQPDILAILLDPKLTDKWTPFTTDEICFSLKKYSHDFTSNAIIP